MSKPWSVRDLAAKKPAVLTKMPAPEKIFAVVGFAFSLRAMWALAKWRKLSRIEQKLDASTDKE